MSKTGFRLPFQALLFVVVAMASALAQAQSNWNFYSNTVSLFKLEKDDACSVVRVHSLYRNESGQVYHQEGVGWVVLSLQNLGILTPFHVVTQADLVVAECGGNFYPLSKPIVDAERDLSLFQIDGDIESLLPKVLNPMLLAMEKNDDLYVKAAEADPLVRTAIERQWAYKIPRSKFENSLEPIMLSMANFNIVSPPEGKNPQNALLSSPVSSSLVTGHVEKNQSYIKNLIRIENFGIRPGLSGSVLFGIPFNSNNYEYSSATKSARFRQPLETTPRFVLGMVTKTRLNGAETVAISLGDIIDFLEEYPQGKKESAPANRDFEVRYRKVQESNREHLQSYINLKSADGSIAEVIEYCSGEYKNSAESVATKNPILQKILEKQSLSASEKNLLRYANPNAPVSSGKKLDSRSERKSGGGEYGEGGDGFLTPQSTFLTSQTSLGNFDEGFFQSGIRNMSKASSFGLYISPAFCKARGLTLDGRLIHGVKLPGKNLTRLLNFEDLRSFQKTNGVKTLDLLRKYGQTSHQPFFTSDLEKINPLEIPLSTRGSFSSDDSTWRAGEKIYFKQMLIPAQPELRESGIIINLDLTDKRPSDWEPGLKMYTSRKELHAKEYNGTEFLKISSKELIFKTELKTPGPLADSRFKNNFELRYNQGKWKSSLSLGQSCRIEMTPEYFTQVNPWRLEYNDGRTQASVEFMSQDKVLSLRVQKGNCLELKNLALGEVDVYLNGEVLSVAGTPRTVLTTAPVNWSELAAKFSSAAKK